MPYTAVLAPDDERVKRTEGTLCHVFDIPSIRDYQRRAGHNMLKGVDTVLDIPTGGGKTLAFWYAHFYFWNPGSPTANLRKIILVIGPLVALMNSQAALLREKGIPAIAVTGKTKHPTDVLKVRLLSFK